MNKNKSRRIYSWRENLLVCTQNLKENDTKGLKLINKPKKKKSIHNSYKTQARLQKEARVTHLFNMHSVVSPCR